MTIIYKYPLEIRDAQQIKLPAGSKILNVQMQGDQLCLWAEVYPDQNKKEFTIRIYGTGRSIHGQNSHYIGTVQDGAFVWHVFIETEYSREAFTPAL